MQEQRAFISTFESEVTTSITGLKFDDSLVQAFEIKVMVTSEGNYKRYALYTIKGCQANYKWELDQLCMKGCSNFMLFSITNDGQVNYVCYDGSQGDVLTLKFKVLTIDV